MHLDTNDTNSDENQDQEFIQRLINLADELDALAQKQPGIDFELTRAVDAIDEMLEQFQPATPSQYEQAVRLDFDFTQWQQQPLMKGGKWQWARESEYRYARAQEPMMRHAYVYPMKDYIESKPRIGMTVGEKFQLIEGHLPRVHKLNNFWALAQDKWHESEWAGNAKFAYDGEEGHFADWN